MEEINLLNKGSMENSETSERSLYSDFSALSLKAAHSNRSQFLSYLDQVRLTAGVDAAVDILRRYVEAGLLPALAALAAQTIARRSNDYDLCVLLTRDLRRALPRDAFVASAHIESLLAAGRLSELTKEFDSVLDCSNIRYTEDTALRLASTAAASGSWHECDYFLGVSVAHTPANDWRRRSLAARSVMGKQFKSNQLDFPATIINLPGDQRKYVLARSLYRQMDIELSRLDAVRGGELSGYLLQSVVSSSGLILGRGAIGCALSHIAAWERIAAGGDDHGLVIEDDGLPYSWQNLDEIVDLAGNFDVLYVNERMSSIPCQKIETGYSPIWETLGSRPNSMRGWGGDGYVLSRQGSEKLLSLISIDKIVGHIDGQIGSYGVSPTQVPESRAQAVGVACRANMISNESLVVKCLRFPLVASYNFGHSSIVAAGGHH